MACDTPIQPISDWLNYAYQLSGSQTNGTLSAYQIKMGLLAFNMILKSFGNSPLYIPYQSTMEIVSTGAQEYVIGLKGDREKQITVQNNVPMDISYLSYNIGGATYVCDYMTPQAYESIGIKGSTGLANKYSFEVRDKYTLLHLYPVLQAGAVMKLMCKKRFSDVSFYTSQDQIDGKYELFMVYRVAAELQALGLGGKSNSAYAKNYAMYTDIALDSNDDNYALDRGTKPSSSGAPFSPN